jgi:hypothetical protein
MNRLFALACSLPALVVSTAAQIPIDPVLVKPTEGLDLIQRPIAAGIGVGNALRVVRYDPDGDLLHDLAVLWSSGEVDHCHAPEVMTSIVPCPVSGATDIARIPGSRALGGSANDGLLVATATGLAYLAYESDEALAPTGFVQSSVPAPSEWQSVVRLEVEERGGVCWIAGVAGDDQTVLVGTWGWAGITTVGSFTASGTVRQMLFLNAWSGEPQVVVRTASTIEFHELSGAPLAAPVVAPASSPFGGIARLVDGGGDRVAWLAYADTHWLLEVWRLDASAGPVQEASTALGTPGYLLPRFRPLGLARLPVLGGRDALVLTQNTGMWQGIYARAEGSQAFVPSSWVEMPGLAYPIDRCPPIVEDMDNDGERDLVTVLTTAHRVQIDRALPDVAAEGIASLQDGDATEVGPILEVTCPMAATDDEIELRVEIPGGWSIPDGLEIQVTAWPHRIDDPTTVDEPSQVVGDAEVNAFWRPYTEGSSVLVQKPRVPLVLDSAELPWSPHNHYYLMLRFVVRTGNTLTQAFPARFGVLVVGLEPPTTSSAWIDSASLNYAKSISTPNEPPFVFTGNNRNVGVILTPPRISPPNSTIKPPASPPGPSSAVSGGW